MKTDRRTLVVLVAAGIAVLWISHLSRGTWIRLAVLVPAIILHEISHGVVALAFGDDGGLAYDQNFADSSQVTAERG